MYIFNHRKALLGFAIMMSLFLAVVATQNTLAARNQVSDMNDRFADVDTRTGANGFARVRVTQVGEVVVDRVKAKNLLPNTEYQVVVAVQYNYDPITTQGPSASGSADQVEYSGAVPTDKHGNFVLDNFDFELPQDEVPGTHRMDVFVTNLDENGVGSPGGGENISNAIERDPLLACQPTFIVTVVE